MATKDRLHRLVDDLPEPEVPAAERYLQYLQLVASDPVFSTFLNAPEDDEPLTAADLAAIDEAHQAVTRGEVRPWEQVRAEILG